MKEEILMICKNCPDCNVQTGTDLCKRLKCTATKRGRTLTWTMCCIYGDGTAVNAYQYFADYLEKHAKPNWCPKTQDDISDKIPAGLDMGDIEIEQM